MIDPSDFRAVGQAVKEAISWLTGYPCEVLRLDLDLNADLGLDENKYEETWAILHAMFPTPPQPRSGISQYPSGAFHTIRDVARWFFTGPPADACLPDSIPGLPVAEPLPDGVTESDRGQTLASGPVTDKLPPNPDTLPSIPRGAITTRLPRHPE